VLQGIERRKSFAGVMDWQGWAITLGCPYSDGTGERGPGKYDGKFEAAPDIDHGNMKVQQSIQLHGFGHCFIILDRPMQMYLHLQYPYPKASQSECHLIRTIKNYQVDRAPTNLINIINLLLCVSTSLTKQQNVLKIS
jgi:hypothetical protein